jgi:hypothetical protein
MTPEQRRLLDRLEYLCELKTDEEIDEFVDVVRSLRALGEDLEVLAGMLRCFRDVDAGEVQYELIEACEAYPPREYTRAFVHAAPKQWEHAPIWLDLMFHSLMNSDSYQRSFLAELRKAPEETKDFFRARGSALAAESDQYAEVARAIAGT